MTITDPLRHVAADSAAAESAPIGLLASIPRSTDPAVRAALERGAIHEALAAAVDGDDLPLAIDVLRVGWFELLKHEHRDTTRAMLEKLSTAQLMSHPLLAMALGLLYNADGVRRSKAVYYFGLAAAGVRAHPSRLTPAERALVLTSESAALRLTGKTSLSVSSARAGLKALEAIRDERANLIGYLPRLYAQLGTSLYYGGHEAESLHVFDRGFAEAGTDDRSSFGNLAMAAGIHSLAGNMGQAAERVELARGESWSDDQRCMYVGTFYRIAEALLALERFDVSAARAHLSAMRHDRRTIEHWLVIARVEALTALLGGDASCGLASVEDWVVLRSLEGDKRATRQRLSSIRSLLHIALGNYEAAGTVLHSDAGQTPQDHVDRARLALATGRTGDALKQLRVIAGRPQSQRTLAEALGVEAAIGLRTGRDRRTMAVLQQLVSVLRYSGQRVAVHLVPPDDLAAILAAFEDIGAADLLEPRPTSTLLAQPDHPALTPRERSVLNALARSGALNDIAAELFVSTNTVKTHLRSLYRKLGARNREEALTVALHWHLISSAPVHPPARGAKTPRR